MGELNERRQQLLDDLRAVQGHLRARTLDRFRRINPFTEDLADWHERAAAWPGAAEGVTIYDSTTVVGEVTIGAHTWIGPFCSLDGTGGLTIGAHCSISLGAQLLTHDTVAWALSAGRRGAEHAPTRIGDRCFIGSHAVVAKGVTVGDEAVIGAGAVVLADVPANAIAAGVPARVIGTTHVDGDRVELRYSSEPAERPTSP